MIEAARRPANLADSSDLQRRRRVYAIAAGFVVASLILIGRLAYVQVYEHQRYQSLASAEHLRQTVVAPRRGDIVDVNGQSLATTVDFDSLYASTNEIVDPAGVAKQLAPILGVPQSTLQATLSRSQTAPTLLQSGLSTDLATRVQQLGLAGFYVQPEPQRVYPQGTLAAQVLGVVGVDDKGLSGLELAFDADLAGKPGSLVAERDTGGDAIAFSSSLAKPATDGARLTLTIDRFVQWVAERELTASIDQQHATGGTVVILDPRTGAILGLASRPSFQPDDPARYQPSQIALYGIPGVASAFEPDSVFTIFTLAAGLDSGQITSQTNFNYSGPVTYDGETIADAVARPAAPMSMEQVLETSSGVGAAWIATRVGAHPFYATMQRFGIGTPTAVDLPGEVSGFLRLPSAVDWSNTDLVTNAVGQGIAVTPIQLADALAAVANGGRRMKPFVVQHVAGAAGERDYSPTPLGQAIQPQTAEAVTRLLMATVDDVAAVDLGPARVPGYAIAGAPSRPEVLAGGGSTLGTSQASFVGFAPAEQPRFVVVIRIDGQKDGNGSALTASPVFGAIVRQLLSYYQIPPSRPVPTGGT